MKKTFLVIGMLTSIFIGKAALDSGLVGQWLQASGTTYNVTTVPALHSSATGDLDVIGELDIGGNATIGGDIAVTGNVESSDFLYGEFLVLGDKTYADPYFYAEDNLFEGYGKNDDYTIKIYNDVGDYGLGVRASDGMFMVGTTVSATYELDDETAINMDTSKKVGIGQLPDSSYKLALLGDTKFDGNVDVTGMITGEDLEIAGTVAGGATYQFINKDVTTTSGVEIEAKGGYGSDPFWVGNSSMGKIKFYKDNAWSTDSRSWDSHMSFVTTNAGAEKEGVSIDKNGKLNVSLGMLANTIESVDINTGVSPELVYMGSNAYIGTGLEIYSESQNNGIEIWNNQTADYGIGVEYASDILKIGGDYELISDDGININMLNEVGIGQAPTTDYKLAVTGDSYFTGNVESSDFLYSEFLVLGDKTYADPYLYMEDGWIESYSGSVNSIFQMLNDGSGNYTIGVRHSDDMYMIGTNLDLTVETAINMDTSKRVGIGQLPDPSYKFSVTGDTKFTGDHTQTGDITLAGGLYESQRTITSSASAADTDIHVWLDGSSNALAYSLPTPTAGRVLHFTCIDDTYQTAVAPNASETINGVAGSKILAQWETFSLISDGTNWVSF